VSAGAAFVFVAWPRVTADPPSSAHVELLRFGFDLLQVVAIGGVAAVMLERFKNSQAQRAKRVAQRDEWIKNVRAAYSRLKTSRRLLQDQFAGDTVTAELCARHRDLLNKHGRRLIEPQLELEFVSQQLRESKDSSERTAAAEVKTLEQNFNRVSDALRMKQWNQPEVELISQFVGSQSFRSLFTEHHHRTIAALRNAG
jgi:hypothetical protein